MTGSQKALYYYLANQDTINDGHIGQYVAIYDNKVEGYYAGFWEAFRAMAGKEYPLGSFNINQCLPGDEWMVHTGYIQIGGGGSYDGYY
jgi:hypothetical protein